MFTGIIEEMGTVRRLDRTPISCRLTIAATLVLQGTQIGDSIAVNGVCLTVTDLQKDAFTADIMPETLRRSSLGILRSGSSVNLERAMVANGRFGGHIVSGHIDGTGTIASKVPEGNAQIVTISAAPNLLRYIVETLLSKRPGDPVNLETDVIGKYVEKLMQPITPPLTASMLQKYGF